MTLGRDLKRFAGKSKRRMETVARLSLNELGNRIVQSSPVDTGAFRANWLFSYDNVPTEFDLSKKDRSGAEATGRMAQQLQVLGDQDFFVMVNNMPYAQRLENGWSQQAGSGVVSINVIDWQAIVRNNLR